MNPLYAIRSGKNVKLFYFARHAIRDLMPGIFFRKYDSYLAESRRRPDYDYILRRVSYYCKSPGKPLGPSTVAVKELVKKECASTYYYDAKEALSAFPSSTRINFLPGDITFVPEYPSLTKSRPIGDDNDNSVIMKFDRIRHFIHISDGIKTCDKEDRAVFRGKVPGKEKRVRFFKRHFDNPRCDLGDTQRDTPHREWLRPKMTIADQLRYKFILSIEGNDVASNLKWVMGSNSAAVMPLPEYETWFMEGLLKPGEHYIPISPDFSDLDEVIDHYLSSPAELGEIVANANGWCRQFLDLRRERLIEVLTVGAYLGLFDPTTERN